MSTPTVMTAMFAIVMMAMASGQVMQLAPDKVEAAKGRDSIFQIIDRKPEIDLHEQDGAEVDFEDVPNSISFSSVDFAYPSRADQPVLKSIDLSVPFGSTVAIVGASGSGKSTIINLVLRLYDVNAGSLCIGGTDVRSLNMNKFLRQV